MIITRSIPWHARSTLSRSAHVIARIGLALTGTACGLFVAQVSARIDLVGSVEAMLAMMLYGAAGFYLGIDLPQAPPDHHMHLPLSSVTQKCYLTAQKQQQEALLQKMQPIYTTRQCWHH